MPSFDKMRYRAGCRSAAEMLCHPIIDLISDSLPQQCVGIRQQCISCEILYCQSWLAYSMYLATR